MCQEKSRGIFSENRGQDFKGSCCQRRRQTERVFSPRRGQTETGSGTPTVVQKVPGLYCKARTACGQIGQRNRGNLVQTLLGEGGVLMQNNTESLNVIIVF